MTDTRIFRIGCISVLLLLAVPAFAQGEGAEIQDPGGAENDLIRTFFLENSELKDMMTMLRATLGLKHIAADQELDALLVRDTAEQLERAAEIVRVFDRPRSEVAVAVKLIELDSRRLRELARELDGDGAMPLRLTADGLARLEGSTGARVLAYPTLSAVGRRKAEFLSGDRIPITVDGHGAVSYQEVGFKLAVTSRVHPGAGEVTLDFQLEQSRVVPDTGDPERPVIDTQSIESSVRLVDGETWFVTGLSWPGLGDAGAGEGEDQRQVGLAATPHIIRRGEDGGYESVAHNNGLKARWGWATHSATAERVGR